MIFIRLLLTLSVFELHAYEDVFRAKSHNEIQKVEVRQAHQQDLIESCHLKRLKGGFRWPCFLVPGSGWTHSAMNEHCKEKLTEVASVAALPAGVDLKKMTQACQALVRARRRILDYKAIGT